MTEPRRSRRLDAPILLPFDGSEPSVAAARAIAHLVRGQDAVVRILTVGDELPPGIDDVIADLGAAARVQLVAGDPGLVIPAEAERHGVGLIALGSRSRSVLTGVLLGSTARAVLAECRRPTMVVHADTEAPFPPGPVVAAVDASPRSLEIAGWAGVIADALGRSVALVTVMDVDRDLARRPTAYGVSAADWEQRVADLYAAAIAPGERLLGITGAGTVRYGVPSDQLREHADTVSASVVVVGRRGASGVEADAWRSVAYALAANGPFATLVL